MDLEPTQSLDASSIPFLDEPSNDCASSPSFSYIDSLQYQKWDVPTRVEYDSRSEAQFPEIQPSLESTYFESCSPDREGRRLDQTNNAGMNNCIRDWNPELMLNNLSVLEQKIHELQGVIRTVVTHESPINNFAAQQQLATSEVASIIVQLMSTAGTLLPCLKNSCCGSSTMRDLDGLLSSSASIDDLQQFNTVAPGVLGTSDGSDELATFEAEQNCLDELKPPDVIPGDHDAKEFEDIMEVEHLPPGSYEILQLEKEEILAPHTHFCAICGKGFKRDANLRMHMRGHGDEYKTTAALSKPFKEIHSNSSLIKRYSCPFVGCKRNKEHEKFMPLKTILCVKNHYKRSHCDKSYTCSRCNSKKFSVIADLKTHEKHCGRDKWLCSCGTTFSRKDKLFGHVALFQGHSPVLTMDENKEPEGTHHGQTKQSPGFGGSRGFEPCRSADGKRHALEMGGVAHSSEMSFGGHYFV